MFTIGRLNSHKDYCHFCGKSRVNLEDLNHRKSQHVNGTLKGQYINDISSVTTSNEEREMESNVLSVFQGETPLLK